MTKTWNNGNYILINGYAKEICVDPKNFKDITESRISKDHGALQSIGIHYEHPIMVMIKQNRDNIIKMVQKKFKLPELDMLVNGNKMSSGKGISIHNDWFEENERGDPSAVLARGVLSLNPTYVFGTNLYDTWDENSFNSERGGYPGDLFIFKCSPDSHHSVGLKSYEHVDRYTLNMMFIEKQML